jgi:hypothetical protein
MQRILCTNEMVNLKALFLKAEFERLSEMHGAAVDTYSEFL